MQGIFSGDVMVVGSSSRTKEQNHSLAVLDNLLLRGFIKGDSLYLNPENENFKPIEITEEIDFKVWGVVTHIIHKV